MQDFHVYPLKLHICFFIKIDIAKQFQYLTKSKSTTNHDHKKEGILCSMDGLYARIYNFIASRCINDQIM